MNGDIAIGFSSDESLASFLSKQTEKYGDALRHLSSNIFKQSLRSGNILLAKNGNNEIVASMRLIPRGNDIIELGSMWSQERGVMRDILTFLFASKKIQKKMLALVTQQDNKNMRNTAERNNFSKCSTLPNTGLIECIEKDGIENNRKRLLFVRSLS